MSDENMKRKPAFNESARSKDSDGSISGKGTTKITKGQFNESEGTSNKNNISRKKR